ncbi:MAG: substrate-binding domain-containing protein [Planctomycetes bacterium]|nr:substrate-binding domain-containing protein [Planctomycetota bacterium]
MSSKTRLGRINGVALSILGSLALLAGLVWSLRGGEEERPSAGRLTLYCAAGLKPPVEAAARAYEERYGVRIDITYGGSGTLLSSLKVAESGDLYLAADESYCELARGEGLARETFALATMRPVVGVQRGNPKGIARVADLLGPEVRLGVANPEAAAAGRVVRSALTESGHWESVQGAAKVTKPTVMDLANDLNLGSLDASLVWDSTVNQFDGLESVDLPELAGWSKSVTICVLESSEEPTAALRFCRFLSARDAGLPLFEEMGYEPVDGDLWEERPELLLFSGGMLNSAIDDTVRAFEEREGVSVTRVYNGCGILVAQMNAGASPDAYFSCDQTFLDVVSERFEPGTTVSSNRMVILVRKGNPSNIQGLADLCVPGLEVGLGHPEKSALGALSYRVFESAGLSDRLEASGNVILDSATGDFLVNQMRTGSLDAVIVYRSNAAAALEDVDMVEIDRPGALATQPFAISHATEHKQTLGRLLDTLSKAGSRERFDALGFGWERRLPQGSK